MQQNHESLTVIQKYDQIQSLFFLLIVYSVLISNTKETAFAVR